MKFPLKACTEIAEPLQNPQGLYLLVFQFGLPQTLPN